MASPNDTHYKKVENILKAGKDSVFEPCKILSYYPEKMTVDVYCTTSRQERKDVLLLFPSFYLNTGIISPPKKDTTALLFWGPDRQAYALPAQYMIPQTTVSNGVTSLNASPSQADEFLSLKNVQEGDHMIRSFGGSYIFLKSSGDAEISTSKLHKIKLANHDGSLSMIFEKQKTEIQNFSYYNGQYEPNNKDWDRKFDDHHIHIKADDKTTEMQEVIPLSDEGMVNALLNSNPEDIVSDPSDKEDAAIWEMQALNVFDENDIKKISDIDGSELFLCSELRERTGNGTTSTCSTIELSKKGSLKYETKRGRGTPSKIIVSPEYASIESGVIKVSVVNDSDVEFTLLNKTYSLRDMIERIDTLSSAHRLPPL